jgi:hypothetical protein
MSTDRSTRRDFLRNVAAAGALIPAAALLGCGKKAPVCDGDAQLTGLSDADKSARKALKYVDATPEAAKNCANCLQYVAGAPDSCGTCKVLKGPVAPAGYCSTWAAKPGLRTA